MIRNSFFLRWLNEHSWLRYCLTSSSGRINRGAAEPERVYSESPAAWYEAANDSAQISNDGKWALYYHPFWRKMKLINLETGREEAERLSAGMDRVFSASFCMASPAAPIAQKRHEPDANRDLEIYELDLSTGVRRTVVQAPGDDFAPCVANGFL